MLSQFFESILTDFLDDLKDNRIVEERERERKKNERENVCVRERERR
jgi:hypothetical protein